MNHAHLCVPGTAKGHWRTRADIVSDIAVKPVFITRPQFLKTAQILQHWNFRYDIICPAALSIRCHYFNCKIRKDLLMAPLGGW